MLDLLATRASTNHYASACLQTGSPERRYASLICILRGAASLGVLVSASQRLRFSRHFLHLCLMSSLQPRLLVLYAYLLGLCRQRLTLRRRLECLFCVLSFLEA